MGRRVDVDDLVDATQVAALLGLSSRNAVSVYRARYSDFPQPVVDRSKAVLWVREDIAQWAAERGS